MASPGASGCLNSHVSREMRDLIDARAWPVVWAHMRHSLANLAGVAVGRLAALMRNRLKRPSTRPDVLDGFLAGTGLAVGLPPPSP